jgi:hypothetical protein
VRGRDAHHRFRYRDAPGAADPRLPIGEPATPPPIAPARGPPSWEEDDCGVVFLNEERFTGDPLAQPEPEYQFDQRVKW